MYSHRLYICFCFLCFFSSVVRSSFAIESAYPTDSNTSYFLVSEGIYDTPWITAYVPEAYKDSSGLFIKYRCFSNGTGQVCVKTTYGGSSTYWSPSGETWQSYQSEQFAQVKTLPFMWPVLYHSHCILYFLRF